MRDQILAALSKEAIAASKVLTPIRRKDIKDDKVATDTPVPATNVERSTRNEPLAKKKGTGLDKGLRIHVHSRLKKLGDVDGRSAKSVIDGLVVGGLLPDDSARFISEVRFTQEKWPEDETIITLENNGGKQI